MTKETASIRLDVAKRAELDQLAQVFDRDRSYLIGEANDAYLEVQRWYIEQIEAGLEEARLGQFVSDDEVAAVFNR